MLIICFPFICLLKYIPFIKIIIKITDPYSLCIYIVVEKSLSIVSK